MPHSLPPLFSFKPPPPAMENTPTRLKREKSTPKHPRIDLPSEPKRCGEEEAVAGRLAPNDNLAAITLIKSISFVWSDVVIL